MIEIIIPSVAITILITTIIYGLVVAVKAAEDSYPRRVYITVLLVWIFTILFLGYRQFQLVETRETISGYLYCNLILMGIFCQISLMAYAIAVLFHTKIKLKNLLIFLLPAIAVAVANVGWNLYKGFGWFHYYPSMEALKQDIPSVTVALRISMLLVQAFYMGALAYSAIKLVPIYNKYLSNNQANEEYNLHWIYKYITGISIITVVYFIVATMPSNYTTTLYCVVTTYAFMLLTSCVWEYKSFPKFYEVNLKWSIRKGWTAQFANESHELLSEDPIETCEEEQLEVPNIVDNLKIYIIENKLYANVDLTMKDTLNSFNNDEITSVILIHQLAERSLTFQSFIRQIRIECAVAMMAETKGELLYKDIFYKVGFSHYSSFSRAFTTVMGISPAQYREADH